MANVLSSVKVVKSALTLGTGGSVVGYRYSVSFGRSRQYSWDVQADLVKRIDTALQGVSANFQVGRPIEGRLVGNVFKTRNEYGVVELESSRAFTSAFNRLKKRLDVYSSLVNSFSSTVSDLRSELRAKGVSSWGDSEIDAEDLLWACRFIGGFGAWSGGGEDICDADTLNPSVSAKINKAVVALNKKLGKSVNLSWHTGEKAWCYFQFELV